MNSVTTTANGQGPSTPHAASRANREVHNLSFMGQIRGEWIKLWSLRSTFWVLGITILAMAGTSALLGISMRMWIEDDGPGAIMDAASNSAIVMMGLVVNAIMVAQLVMVVFGVLSITTEYASGQIRSSFNANPKRTGLLFAKATVVAMTAFVVGIVGMAISYFVLYTFIGADLPGGDYTDPEFLRMFFGSGLYLATITIFAFTLGGLLKRSAGALATVFAILLVVPSIFMMIPLDWMQDVVPYLPDAAGSLIYAPPEVFDPEVASSALTPWTGYLVLLGYVVVLFTATTVITKGRDV